MSVSNATLIRLCGLIEYSRVIGWFLSALVETTGRVMGRAMGRLDLTDSQRRSSFEIVLNVNPYLSVIS